MQKIIKRIMRWEYYDYFRTEIKVPQFSHTFHSNNGLRLPALLSLISPFPDKIWELGRVFFCKKENHDQRTK